MENIYICEEVAKVRTLHRPILDNFLRYPTLLSQLSAFAEQLEDQFKQGNPAVSVELSNYHPSFLGKEASFILSQPLTTEDFRLTIAREYGFSNWQEVEKKRGISLNPIFETAVNALIHGDERELRGLLSAHPELVESHSEYGHKAGLIHYVGSNGVEIWRQVVPNNLVNLTQLLLDRGANPNMPSQIYGGANSALALVESSAHPWDAGIGKALVKTLKQ